MHVSISFLVWTIIYSKTCRKRPLKKNTKIDFQDRLSLNAGQKYCRMLQESILQYFQPSLSYHLPYRPLFCLFLSGLLRQVLLYFCLKACHMTFTHLFHIIFHIIEHTFFATCSIKGPRRTDKQPCEGVCTRGQGLDTTEHLRCFQTIPVHLSTFIITSHWNNKCQQWKCYAR